MAKTGRFLCVSKRTVFEITLHLNSRVNPNTLRNMSCKNFYRYRYIHSPLTFLQDDLALEMAPLERAG